MFKNDLVRRVAKETRLSQKIVSDVIGSTLKEITASLSKPERVTFPGFGTFYTRQRPASKARSFKTGKTVDVPELTLAAFRVGELLKRAVRKSKKPQRRGRLFGKLGNALGK